MYNTGFVKCKNCGKLILESMRRAGHLCEACWQEAIERSKEEAEENLILNKAW